MVQSKLATGIGIIQDPSIMAKIWDYLGPKLTHDPLLSVMRFAHVPNRENKTKIKPPTLPKTIK